MPAYDPLEDSKRKIDKLLALDYEAKRRPPSEVPDLSLAEFIQTFWHIIEPATPLVWGWYLDAICAHLEAVTDGRIRNLIINIPPRMSKSTIVAIMWPCWVWTFKPHIRWLFSSYGADISERDSLRCKRLIRCGEYQARFGRRYQIMKDKDTVQKFETTRAGYRIATSVEGIATGEGGDIVVVDDPLKSDDANSDTKRNSVNRWWAETMSSRLNNQDTGARVIIMQRLHENDLTGYVRENSSGYEWLCLPMEYEIPRDDKGNILPKHRTCLGFEDPRNVEGELLCPERFSDTTIIFMKENTTEYGWAGQYQQRPAPRGGGMFHIDKIEIVPQIPSGAKLIRVRAWDRAATQGGGAYTAGVRFAFDVVTSTFYIEDVQRGQWATDKRESETMQTARMDGFNTYIVLEQEPGSAGKDSVYATTKMLLGFRVFIDKVSGNKELRAEPFATQVGIGNVKLVAGDWNTPFLKELENFPQGKYKDQVDSASLGFNWIARMRTTPRESVSTPVPERFKVS